MASWIFLGLGLVALWLALPTKAEREGPEYDRKRLRGIEAGRAQQRREHEQRCCGRGEQ